MPGIRTGIRFVSRLFLCKCLRNEEIETTKESALDGEIVQWAHDSMATLLQDMGVDHGGTDVRVPQQRLDGANVRTPLQKMSGEAVPERMRTDPLADSCLADDLGNGLVDGAGVKVVAASLAGARVSGPTTGGEDILPSPVLVGVRVLAGQGVREIHLSIAVLQILSMGSSSRVQGVLSGAVRASRGTS